MKIDDKDNKENTSREYRWNIKHPNNTTMITTQKHI
jgi:hypothetical protein